jgi:hypothetical protein
LNYIGVPLSNTCTTAQPSGTLMSSQSESLIALKMKENIEKPSKAFEVVF